MFSEFLSWIDIFFCGNQLVSGKFYHHTWWFKQQDMVLTHQKLGATDR